MKISAAMNSFHDMMKAKSATVTMPGSTSGRKTRRRICSELQPSITEASSISRGMPSKLLRIR